MTTSSGAGAAATAGIAYQNRVAAYYVATSICVFSTPSNDGKVICTIGLETREAVDDINITFTDGSCKYLQAKTNVTFSFGDAAPLRSVFEQFVTQHRANKSPNAQYALVTTSTSSRKVTREARAALEAFRLCDTEQFRRDQPAAIVAVIDELLDGVADIAGQKGCDTPHALAEDVLRHTHIIELDLDAGGWTEEMLILLLASRHYISPAAFWSKIIVDCIEHSRARHTFSIDDAKARYAKFLSPPAEQREAVQAELVPFSFEMMGQMSVGKEVILAVLSDSDTSDNTLLIAEMRRFDDDCNERVRFEGDTCIMRNGVQLKMMRRTATMAAMERYVDRHRETLSRYSIGIAPYNGDENLEEGLCCDRHRTAIRSAFAKVNKPVSCLHCGQTVSTNDGNFIERGHGDDLQVGIAHESCTRPIDRVLGIAKIPFFEKFDFLVNFDAAAWAKAFPNGQRGLREAASVRDGNRFMWGGRRLDLPPGNYVIESVLENGEVEYVRSRGFLERSSKAEAERDASEMNAFLERARSTGDPMCYTSETRRYGPRSLLLAQVGAQEQILEVRELRVTHFRTAMEAMYSTTGYYYAPLAFIRSVEGDLLSFGDFIPLISNPLQLDGYLDNWRRYGPVEITDYEVAVLESDRQFDDFAELWFGRGFAFVVDMMLDPRQQVPFISGTLILSEEHIKAAAAGPSSELPDAQ